METEKFPGSVNAMPVLAGIKGQRAVIYIKNVLRWVMYNSLMEGYQMEVEHQGPLGYYEI